jgi:hypothetical protein
MMTFTCDNCQASTRGTPEITVTGRRLCATCKDNLVGAAAGLIAGGDPSDAVATARIFSALRRWRRKLGR